MSSILLTGFPGFLGTRLLPQLLHGRPEDTAVCVVQAEYMDLARKRVLELVASEPGLDGRIRLPQSGRGQHLGLDVKRGRCEYYYLVAWREQVERTGLSLVTTGSWRSLTWLDCVW